MRLRISALTTCVCSSAILPLNSGPSQRQCAGGGGVIELGLAREDLESRDVEVELGSREARARVDELDLADRALVAFAARDAKACAGRFRARLRGGERVRAGVEPIERLLDLELHLLSEFIPLRGGSARRGVRLAHGRTARAAVEESPVEQQRNSREVAATAEFV